MRKQTLLKRLQLFKVSMTESIEALVREAETDIDNGYDSVACGTQEHIRNAEKRLSVLNILSEELANKSDPVMVYKKALDCNGALRETQVKTCAFTQNMTPNGGLLTGIIETVERSMKDGRYLGNIRIADIDAMKDIPNMCILPDGSFCLADYHGRKVIRMDNEMKEIDTFATESNVWGVCALNQTEVAFTMPTLMKVQVAAYDRKPPIKTSFYTKIHCRGIAYCNENIYVGGGGFSEEESGQIHIFDLKGKLLYMFEHDSDGNYFNIPRSVIADTEYIYVTDCINGVICLDLHGERKWIFKNTECKYPWGICFTQKENLLISCRDSNNVVVVNKDGELMGELLNESDGISAPYAVSIDIPNNRLLVTASKSNALKMFEYEDCEI